MRFLHKTTRALLSSGLVVFLFNSCAELPIVGEFFSSPLRVLYTRGPVLASDDGRPKELRLGRSIGVSRLNTPNNGLVVLGVGGPNRMIVLPDSLVELSESEDNSTFHLRLVRGAVYLNHSPRGGSVPNPYTGFAVRAGNNGTYMHSGGEAVVEVEPQTLSLFSISGQGTWSTPALNTILSSPRRLSVATANANLPVNPVPLSRTGLFELYKRIDQITRQGSAQSENIALSHKAQIDQVIDAYLASRRQGKAPSVAGRGVYHLFLKSSPPNANIYVNDTYKGKTPIKVAVGEGRHRVRFRDPRSGKEIVKVVTASEELAGIFVEVHFPTPPKKPAVVRKPAPSLVEPEPATPEGPEGGLVPPVAEDKPEPPEPSPGEQAKLVLSMSDDKTFVQLTKEGDDGGKTLTLSDFEREQNNHTVGLEAGTYHLEATRIGFLSRVWRLELEAGKTYQQAIDLSGEKVSFSEAKRIGLNPESRRKTAKTSAGVHADEKGLFVGDSDNKVVVHFDLEGNYLSDLSPPRSKARLSIPTDIDRLPGKNVLVVSDVRRNQVIFMPFEGTNNEDSIVVLTNNFLLPGGMDHHGEVGLTAVANGAQNEIVLLEGMEELRRLGELDLSDPNDVVFLDDGSLIVSDWGNLRLVKANLEGELLAEKKIDFIPSGLEVAEQAYLFVANSKDNSIFVFDGGFKRLDTLRIERSENFEPSGMSYFNSKLYVAMRGGGFVVVFDFIHRWGQKHPSEPSEGKKAPSETNEADGSENESFLRPSGTDSF